MNGFKKIIEEESKKDYYIKLHDFVDNEYICDEIEYSGILYKADRDIGNVSNSDN